MPWFGAVRFDLTNLIRLIAKNTHYVGEKGFGLALGTFFSNHYCELKHYFGLFGDENSEYTN